MCEKIICQGLHSKFMNVAYSIKQASFCKYYEDYNKFTGVD